MIVQKVLNFLMQDIFPSYFDYLGLIFGRTVPLRKSICTKQELMYKWNWKGSVWANERQLRSSDAIRQASMGLCAICRRVITELISGQLGGQSDLWAWTTERERLNRLMTRSLFTIEEDCDRPQTAHLAFTTKQAWGQISLKPESRGKADRRERKGQCFGKWEGLEERTGNSSR